MGWEQLTKVSDEVEKLTTKLKEEADNIEKICTNYRELPFDERPTLEELYDIRKVTERLAEVQVDLRDMQNTKASEKIRIAFVGATSSGKSSLINALLQESCLPVEFLQTAMCPVEVCTSTEKEWGLSVTGKHGETTQLSGKKSIKDLLGLITGRKQRKELGIHTHSTVQVNLPRHLCNVLPLNVVLLDTPGYGENLESTEVVTNMCRKANIIVAVMDATSPSMTTVS